MKLVNDITY